MSNYSALKTAIQQAVYTNGNNEITGAGLQAVLLQIVNTVGDGYVFKGVATTGTSAGTPDANVFYIAPAGTYTNFGSSYTVPVGSIGVFSYNGTWMRNSVKLYEGVDNVPTSGSDNLVKSGGVYSEVTRLDGEIGEVSGVHELIGYDGTATLQNVPSTVVCPVKKASEGGMLQSIKIQSESAGTIIIYIGSVNNSLYFEKRQEYIVNVTSGLQTIDLTSRHIAVNKDEQIAVLLNGNRYYNTEVGTPLDDESFYYSNTPGSLQLQTYGELTKRIEFKVQFDVLVGTLPHSVSTLYGEIDRNAESIREVKTGLVYAQDVTSMNDTSKMLYESIINAAYYDPAETDNPYIRLAGYFNSSVQITTTYDHVNFFDFKQKAAQRPTGVHKYMLENGDKKLYMTIDWDILTSNYNDTSSSTFYINSRYLSDVVYPIIEPLQDAISGETEIIGCSTTTRYQTQPNTVVCPVRKARGDGKVTSIYLKSANAGKVTIYVGGVDQYLLFVSRVQHELDVVVGDNTIDTSLMDIYIKKGEQIAVCFNGNRYWDMEAGLPEDDQSFYYSNAQNSMQLQVFGNPSMRIMFAFQYTIVESELTELEGKAYENEQTIIGMQAEVGNIQSNMNIARDRDGNKYKLIVVDGEVVPFALNFHHLMAVGNSYTIHPTVSDTEPDYANSLWWGHWSMAATSQPCAWTALLQETLRQKDNSAVVTPVFGRRYETGRRALTDNDAFTYYENGSWQNLKPNISQFSDVDCVLFFLGDNYTIDGNWYNKYKPMVEQFEAWFPNAMIICCSTRSRAINNEAIAKVAEEESAVYVSLYGLTDSSKIGSYVYGDDGILHQIDNQAVANHFGDYGQWAILDNISSAIGYENAVPLYNVTINGADGVTLYVQDESTLQGSIVSVFANVDGGATLNGISVTAGGSSVAVTDHGETSYGRVFTFVMPANDVAIIPV